MKLSTLGELHCPYCGSNLELIKGIDIYKDEIINAVLKCNCRRYPLVEGILVLKTLNLSTMNQALLEMERNNSKEALLWLLEPRTTAFRIIRAAKQRGLPFSNMIEKLRMARTHRYLQRVTKAESFSWVIDHIASIGYGGYFKYRFSSTSFIAGIPLILLMRDFPGAILELGCGMGYHGFVISQLYPQRKLVLADFSFTNLYLAKRFFVPEAEYICLNANDPLPFQDRSFHSIFSSAIFPYLYSKKLAMQEIARVSTPNKIILLSHLHNLYIKDPAPGEPLSAKGWFQLSVFPQTRLFPELKIFNDFFMRDRLDLLNNSSQKEMEQAHAFVLIGTDKEELFRVYQGIGEPFFRKRNNLIINPIYRIILKSDKALLQKKWPSTWMKEENIDIDRLLPETVYIDKELLREISQGRVLRFDPNGVTDLMKKLILINTP